MLKAVLVALFLLHPALFGQQQAGSETDRLIATGKLWGTIKYFHPYLAYRDIDWDKALVDALPKIRSAATSAEYAAAITSLLDALRDSATYAIPDAPSRPDASLKIDRQPDGLLIISQTESQQPETDASEQLVHALTTANRVVLDLRAQPGAPNYLSSLLEDPAISKLLTRTALDTPPQRTWVHNGLPPASQLHSDAGYSTAFYTTAGAHIEGDSAAREKVTFIVNENSRLPHIGSALWGEGRSAVVAASKHFQFADASSVVLPMGQGVSAVVRLSEPLASRELEFVTPDAALPRALAALAGSNSEPIQTRGPDAPSPRPDLPYKEMRYPSAEYRILAAYKIWAAFRNFFAYRDLMDEDWDDVFTTFLPKFIAAKDAREYNLTVAEMLTHAADSKTCIDSPELTEPFGKAPLGLRLRLIEQKPVITEVLDPEASQAGIHVGDVVTRLDGESITDRFHRMERYIPASTPQALGYAIMQRVLNGPEQSEASLRIESREGQSRDIRLQRRSSYVAALRHQRSGDVIKLLPGGIGYADLDRLTPDQVDSMFDQFRATKAIIFDLRGNPNGTARSIASRLTEHQDVAAAIVNGPLSLAPDVPYGTLTSSASYFFVQKLPPTHKWKYKARTVVLVDERTIGEAERTGLFFEAANKTEFIGTPSAGADGDGTNFVVPGGITIWFSGHDVRHANGGPLQRLGLQPSITAAPSIAGIRAGRDEVLQKAIEYISPEAKGDPRNVAALRIHTQN